MHFTHSGKENASTATRIAFVALFHVAVAYGLVKSLGTASRPIIPNIVDIFMAPPVAKEPPPPPPKPKVKPEKVEQVVQKPVVPEVVAPIPPEPIVDNLEPHLLGGDPQPPSPPAAVEGPAKAVGMNTAVLADGCDTPAYPTSAARNGESGTVVLALLVGADGRVRDARVDKSSGYRDLDKAARAALSLCKFKPAMVNGEATAGWSAISYVWTLNG
jgi:periplasmic protein TonB